MDEILTKIPRAVDYGIAFVLFLVFMYFYMKERSAWVRKQVEMEQHIKAREMMINDYKDKFKSCQEAYAAFREKYEKDVAEQIELMNGLVQTNAEHSKLHESERNSLMHLVAENNKTNTRLIEVMKSLEGWVKYKMNGKGRRRSR